MSPLYIGIGLQPETKTISLMAIEEDRAKAEQECREVALEQVIKVYKVFNSVDAKFGYFLGEWLCDEAGMTRNEILEAIGSLVLHIRKHLGAMRSLPPGSPGPQRRP